MAIVFLFHSDFTNIPTPICYKLNRTIQQWRKTWEVFIIAESFSRQLFLRCLSKWKAIFEIKKDRTLCRFWGYFIAKAFGISNKYLSFPGNVISSYSHWSNNLDMFIATLFSKCVATPLTVFVRRKMYFWVCNVDFVTCLLYMKYV